jgi:hypothetical protein
MIITGKSLVKAASSLVRNSQFATKCGKMALIGYRDDHPDRGTGECG